MASLWRHAGPEITCTLDGAQGADGIELDLTVRSPRRDPAYSGKQLWRGDCIHVVFDGRADAGGKPDGTGDGRLIIGLGTAGAECQVSAPGRPGLQGSHPEFLRSVERFAGDAATASTRYRLLLPWVLLGSAPGLSGRLALAIIVAHKDTQQKDTLWGDPAQPWHLELTAPAVPVPVAAPGLPLVLGATVARFAAQVAARSVLEVASSTVRREVPLEPGAWRRFAIDLRPADIGDGGIVLRLRQDGVTVWECRQDYESLDMRERLLRERLERLRRQRAPADSAVVTWYLDSLVACLEQARTQRPFMDGVADWPALYGQVLGQLLLKLPQDRIDLAEHSRRGTPLIGAFVSQADDTLQFYALQLPYGFDPATAYPISVYLHGTGSPYVMGGLLTAYDNSGQDTLFREVDIDPARIPPLHRGFVLAPWARGNGMYRGAAGQDVLQSLAEVEGRFRIDPDRRYLTGFSMGCHGAARLATYAPGLWAGVNLAAGFGYWSDASRPLLRSNLAGLPVAIWCGELDAFMLPGARAAVEELRAAGCQVSQRFVPGLPHTYPYDEYNRMVAELAVHRRDPAPARFSYRSDDLAFTGRNGVDMRFDLVGHGGQTAGFTCVVIGNLVEITSDGCAGLHVDCVRLGLADATEVVIRWNGTESYRGRPGGIFLPERFGTWAAPDFGLR